MSLTHASEVFVVQAANRVRFSISAFYFLLFYLPSSLLPFARRSNHDRAHCLAN